MTRNLEISWEPRSSKAKTEHEEKAYARFVLSAVAINLYS